jgi:ADP-ribose pyrophosphatase YjhB (NUDIX family)
VIVDCSAGEPKVVLVRRARPPRAGEWSLPGGRVEFGEALTRAARRELFEETGLEVDVGPLLGVVELIDNDRHFVIFDYLCRPKGGSLSAGDDASEVVLARPSELCRYHLTDAVERVIATALAP